MGYFLGPIRDPCVAPGDMTGVGDWGRGGPVDGAAAASSKLRTVASRAASDVRETLAGGGRRAGLFLDTTGTLRFVEPGGALFSASGGRDAPRRRGQSSHEGGGGSSGSGDAVAGGAVVWV